MSYWGNVLFFSYLATNAKATASFTGYSSIMPNLTWRLLETLQYLVSIPNQLHLGDSNKEPSSAKWMHYPTVHKITRYKAVFNKSWKVIIIYPKEWFQGNERQLYTKKMWESAGLSKFVSHETSSSRELYSKANFHLTK